MATEQRTTSSGNGFLYFAIGALIVAVGVLAWMFYNGETSPSPQDTAIERMADSVGDAVDDIGDATRNLPQPAPAPVPAPAPATPG
ncbi:MAG: hypothetical protein Q8R82_08425 [Hyphomonadaceae bacterium]|nr:hypothetical protein [Hyphomonadaceae bacterium]